MIQSTGSDAVMGILVLLYLAFVVAIYVLVSYPMSRIAEKLGDPSPWQAWVPVLNALQIIRLAEKPWYYFLLLLIPFVGIVIAVMLWMRIAERCYKPSWYGLLSLVPLAKT